MASHLCSKNFRGSVLGFDLASKGRGYKVLYNLRPEGFRFNLNPQEDKSKQKPTFASEMADYRKRKAEKAQDAAEDPFVDADDILEIEDVDPESPTSTEAADIRGHLESLDATEAALEAGRQRRQELDKLAAEREARLVEASQTAKEVAVARDRVENVPEIEPSDDVDPILERIISGNVKGPVDVEHGQSYRAVKNSTGDIDARIAPILDRINEGKFRQARPPLSTEQLDESARRFADRKKERNKVYLPQRGEKIKVFRPKTETVEDDWEVDVDQGAIPYKGEDHYRVFKVDNRGNVLHKLVRITDFNELNNDETILEDEDIEFIKSETQPEKFHRNLQDALRMGTAKGRFEGVQTRRTQDEDNIVEALQMSSAGGRFEGVQSAEIHPGVQRLKEKSRSYKNDTHRDLDEQLGNWQEWDDENLQSDVNKNGRRDRALSYEQPTEVRSDNSSTPFVESSVTLAENVSPATDAKQATAIEEKTVAPATVQQTDKPKKVGILGWISNSRLGRWFTGLGLAGAITAGAMPERQGRMAQDIEKAAASATVDPELTRPVVENVDRGFVANTTGLDSRKNAQLEGTEGFERESLTVNISGPDDVTYKRVGGVSPKAEKTPAFSVAGGVEGGESAKSFEVVDPYIGTAMESFDERKIPRANVHRRDGRVFFDNTSDSAIYTKTKSGDLIRYGYDNGHITEVSVLPSGKDNFSTVTRKVDQRTGLVDGGFFQDSLKPVQDILDLKTVKF